MGTPHLQPDLRPLGRSGILTPQIVMGLWAAGGSWWGPPDDDAARLAIDRSLELGYNAFDTAPIYGYGHSEELLGETVRERRQEVLIFTKGGPVWDERRRVKLDLTPAGLRGQLDKSLQRLQTDYVDLYQIHWPGQDLIAAEVMDTLVAMQSSGKVRAIGCSNYSLAQLQESHRFGHFDSLQPPFNLVSDRVADEILPFCAREEVGVITYGPLLRGILTGKYLEEPQFPTTDIRSSDADFQGERFARINRFVHEMLVPLAEEAGTNAASLALAWNYRQPGVTAAIAGIRSPQQVEDNLRAVTLTEEQWERLEAERGRLREDLSTIE